MTAKTFTDRDMLAYHLQVAAGIIGHYGLADTDMIQPYPGYEHEFSRHIDADSARISASPLGALILAEHPADDGYELPKGWRHKTNKHWSKLPAVAAFAQYLVAEHGAMARATHADTIDSWWRNPDHSDRFPGWPNRRTEEVAVGALKAASVVIEGGRFTPDSLAAVTT